MKLDWMIAYPVSGEILEKMQEAAERCLPIEGVSLPCYITVRLCDDEEIRQINRKHRGLDRATDVLSFPSVHFPDGKTAGSCENLLRREYDDEADAVFLGDIIISVPHLYAQAEEFGHSAEREASYLLVHGICHLMGYDHIKEEEKKRMRVMEELILNSVNMEEHHHD